MTTTDSGAVVEKTREMYREYQKAEVAYHMHREAQEWDAMRVAANRMEWLRYSMGCADTIQALLQVIDSVQDDGR